jgi:hypothetical protein
MFEIEVKVSAKDEFEVGFEVKFEFTMHIIPGHFPSQTHIDVLTYLRSAQRHNHAGYIIKMIKMIHDPALRTRISPSPWRRPIPTIPKTPPIRGQRSTDDVVAHSPCRRRD